jgi:uncharacterized phiE125 gp8 family phage protein
MHAPVLVTPPTAMPVSTAEAKLHLRVDGTDEDNLIAALIAACTEYLDGYAGVLGRCLVTQTWRQDFDRWGKHLRLPLPAATLASVKVRNSAGQLATVDTDDYSLLKDARGSYVRFKDAYVYPADLAQTQGISIEFTAGYGPEGAAVPAPLRLAILLGVGDLYTNREAKVEGLTTNPSFEALITPYRRVGV